jgi:hypothetical protein
MAAVLLVGALVLIFAALAVLFLAGRRPSPVKLSLVAPAAERASRRLLLAIVEEACLRQGWHVANLDDAGRLEATLGRERLLVDVLDPGLDEDAAADQVRRTAALRTQHRLRTGALVAFGAVSSETRRLGLRHRVEVVDGKELAAFLTTAGRPRTA